MSKYIKLEDAINAYNQAVKELVEEEVNEFDLCHFTECSFNTTQIMLIAQKIENLPTIEVSNDCISRQEAIRAICQECAQGGYDECSADCVEAEVLRKLPSLVSGDTISKEALIQSFLVDCECKDRSEAKAVTCSLDTMLELIDDAPPVEPPKKVVAQIKVDIDELVERIKEEYETTDRPVCEDAVSREWILKELNAESEKDYPSFRRVMEKIKNAPPVEPKRPKGEWIGEGDGYADGGIVYDTWYCSECDHCEEGEELALPNFCPNCGADMRGDKE